MRSGNSTIPSLLLCGFVLIPLSGPASEALPKPEPLHLQRGNIRLFYFTEGEHAVARRDLDADGIPDQVEDFLTQTEAAKLLFVDLLGFPDPFLSPRYAGTQFLDIHLRSRAKLKSNGIAYDRAQKFNRPIDPPGTLSLCFNLATSIYAPKNVSAAHEYFHLIQYGATPFKNGWFLEGTARWAEQGLRPVRPSKEPPITWSLSKTESGEKLTVHPSLFTLTYTAGPRFWTPFLEAHDPQSLLPEGPALDTLRALKYVDGTPVLKAKRLPGWRLMRSFLEKFGEIAPRALKDQGYETWSQETRRSPVNNRYLLEAMSEVLSAPKTEPHPTQTSSQEQPLSAPSPAP